MRLPCSLIGLILILSSWGGPAQALGADSTNTAPGGLVIIAPRAWESTLAPFVTFKAQRLPTRFHALEAILTNSPGVDDPERLKRFLYESWRGAGVRYALLVGDVDVLPVRYMVLDRVTPAAFDYAFYPSDLYYADVARADGTFDDWNARQDGYHARYYGEVRGEKNKADPINFDGIDYQPEVAVGRWPVSTPEAAARVAAKTMATEAAQADSVSAPTQRAGLLAVSGWVDSRPLLNRLAARLTNHWQIERLFYADRGAASAEPTPTPGNVEGLFQRGVRFVLHTGHGQPDGWDQCLSMAALDRLTNAPPLPVVMSIGCSTAWFAPLPPYEPYVDIDGVEHAGTDHGEVFTAPPPPPSPYQRGRYNPTGLGEQFLIRSARGAVAYIGCNTGSQPCALTLADGFVTALARQADARLGDLWNAALRHYFEAEHLATLRPNADWYPPSIFFQGMKFMLFGDPTLPMGAAPAGAPIP